MREVVAAHGHGAEARRLERGARGLGEVAEDGEVALAVGLQEGERLAVEEELDGGGVGAAKVAREQRERSLGLLDLHEREALARVAHEHVLVLDDGEAAHEARDTRERG